ncbi:MAG: CBS domain-containing protein, partial [Verrucomicrobiota bacterium]
ADSSVSELMTVDPICIQQDKLAGEVLNLLEKHRIDDLVVVDDEGRAVGMIDTQDLSRLRVV